MPELPDLLYIQKYLKNSVVGKIITEVSVKEPIVIRNSLTQPFDEVLKGKSFLDARIHGPFLDLPLSEKTKLAVNFMLTGRLQYQKASEKPERWLCFSLRLNDSSHLNYCDEQNMGKVYLIAESDYAQVPKYLQQGIDLLSPKFTLEKFKELAAQHRRKQVRVFINDHSVLSSIGNAYADEILFDAQIHPKALVSQLTQDDLERLYDSILNVMEWGIEEVEKAQQPIHIKVRGHMKVRWRKGKPCSRCGEIIRSVGVNGYDAFFCPHCQPATRQLFIDWSHKPA